MNIGIDVRTIGKQRTGDEVYTRYLIQYIKTLSDTEDRYFFFSDRDNTDDPTFHDLPSHTRHIILKPAHKFLWTMGALSKALFEFDIDLIHVHYITPFITPSKTKVVTTIHDVSWREYPDLVTTKDRKILNTLIPLSIRKADTVLTVSHHSMDTINTHFPVSRGKVGVIHNGGYLNTQEKKFSHPKNTYKEIGDTPYFLYVGTLQPRKNVPFLIEQFLIAKKIYQFPHKLVIVGGLSAHNIDPQIHKYQSEQDIVFTDFVSEEDKYRLLAHCFAFCFPSLFEGFGIPVIEAMSFGKPVIASHASCLPEIIGNAGKTIPVDNTHEWQKALYDITVSDEEYQELSQASLHKAKEYTWEAMGQSTVHIYTSLKEK
jgi:glycosyltransferase involved in cell wall biosynthesis